MEVTHSIESDNHVIIGGGPSRAFSIATTAEFVSVLSDALYADKKLAVTREVICNAWDSHISSGNTDKSVIVTITDNCMSIRDFGLGIADENIEEIYCTYGESTKRKESATTGGFGLGSKSPFAVSDTFTVTSFHNGTRTTYAVSKGSEETDGLPEIRTIVSIPTTESGLQVDIPIEQRDMSNYIHIAKKVLFFGEMNGIVKTENDKEVVVVSKDSFKLKSSNVGFILTSDYLSYTDMFTDNSDRKKIYVQYGAVIYTIERHEDYAKYYDSIISKLYGNFNWYTTKVLEKPFICIKAPDSSLSIAPSRESLSYNKQTIAVLTELLEKTEKILYKVHPNYIREQIIDRSNLYFDSIIDGINNHKEFEYFYLKYFNHNKLYQVNSITYFKGIINNKDDLHNYFLSANYELNSKEFSSLVKKCFIKYLKDTKKFKYVKWMKYGIKSTKSYTNDYYNVRTNLNAFRSMLPKDLYKQYGNNGLDKFLSLVSVNSNGNSKFSTANLNKAYIDEFEPFTLVIVNNQVQLRKWTNDLRTNNYVRKQSNIELYRPIFHVLTIPKNKEKNYNISDIANKMESIGYNVVRVWENPQYQVTTTKVNSNSNKPKRSIKGYSLLRDCINEYGIFDWNLNVSAGRNEKPTVFFETATVGGIKQLASVNRKEDISNILHFFPDAVVVSNSYVSSNIRCKFNAIRFTKAIDILINDLAKEDKFINAIASSKVDNLVDAHYIALAAIPEIAKTWGLNSNLKKDYNKYYEFLYNNYSYNIVNKNDLTKEVFSRAEAIASSLPNLNIILERKKYLNYISSSLFDDLMEENDPAIRKETIAVITAALKG